MVYIAEDGDHPESERSAVSRGLRRSSKPPDILVHNYVIPAWRLRVSAWAAKLDERGDYIVVLCNCKWVPNQGQHYRTQIEGREWTDDYEVRELQIAVPA